ncbi:hypothetical protein [uncultured Oscillibacter sp.]|uniref:hypothetical protein n=1 Tax=uncultured Oscillibacter sp. TaxID=876091 RepID=UPI0025ED31C9|nr:hypothetical protein [uncultured Oscillibacter sp.]
MKDAFKRRAEINPRLDQLQKMDPAEVMEEFCALYEELQSLPRPASARPSARGMCYQLRWLIWAETVVLCLMALLFVPGLLRSYMYGGIAVVLILAAPASLAWAIWSSGYRA